MKKILHKLRVAFFPTRLERILHELDAEAVNAVCCARDCQDEKDIIGYRMSLKKIHLLEEIKYQMREVLK